MHKGPFLIRRLGRFFFWPNPVLYRSIGLLRGRGDCLNTDFDLWVVGFPRSANTFAVEAFRLANPTARIASHCHIPTFVIRWLAANKPGIFLVRKPEDAVMSWAVYCSSQWPGRPSGHLKNSLDYYLDFHRILRPYASQLFVASFEAVTHDFGRVIEQFNRKFGTHYAAFKHAPDAVSQCFSRIESRQFQANGPIDELVVCRPSPHRSQAKRELLEQLRTSPALARKLETANGLYARFCPDPGRPTLAPPRSSPAPAPVTAF